MAKCQVRPPDMIDEEPVGSLGVWMKRAVKRCSTALQGIRAAGSLTWNYAWAGRYMASCIATFRMTARDRSSVVSQCFKEVSFMTCISRGYKSPSLLPALLPTTATATKTFSSRFRQQHAAADTAQLSTGSAVEQIRDPGQLPGSFWRPRRRLSLREPELRGAVMTSAKRERERNIDVLVE